MFDSAVVSVICCPLTREKHVEGVVKIIIPLSVETISAKLTRTYQASVVRGALRDKIDLTIETLCLPMDFLG